MASSSHTSVHQDLPLYSHLGFGILSITAIYTTTSAISFSKNYHDWHNTKHFWGLSLVGYSILPLFYLRSSYKIIQFPVTNEMYSCFLFYALFSIKVFSLQWHSLSISVYFPFVVKQRTPSTVRIVIVVLIPQSFAFSLARDTHPKKNKTAKNPSWNSPLYVTSLISCQHSSWERRNGISL